MTQFFDKERNVLTFYNKLVRDKIPDIIESKGEDCKFSILGQESFIHELKKKLMEEVNEYLSATNDLNAMEELADILEILHTLAETHQKTFAEVESIRQNKLKERGGFKNKYFLISTNQQ